MNRSLQRVLVFQVGAELFGLPLEHSLEVQRRVLPEAAPRAPDQVVGTVVSRGRRVPVLDLRQRFNTAAGPADLVVAGTPRGELGLAVDGLMGITAGGTLSDLPGMLHESGGASGVSGVLHCEQGLVLLLDPGELFDTSGWRELARWLDALEKGELVEEDEDQDVVEQSDEVEI